MTEGRFLSPPAWVRARMDAEREAEGWACVEADKHRPVPRESYCSCGYCVWSAEHVVVMVLRSMFEHRVVTAPASLPSPQPPTAPKPEEGDHV